VTEDEIRAGMTAEAIIGYGYSFPRLLPTGEWAALRSFFYTCGLCVGLDKTGYRTRFCYETATDAFGALVTWDGEGDPPGRWLKEKGRHERHNPRYFFRIPVVVEYTDGRSI